MREEYKLDYEFAFKKGGSAPEPQPVVAPVAPIEEASVELDEDDKKKKLKTGKSSLKMPTKIADNVGLKL